MMFNWPYVMDLVELKELSTSDEAPQEVLVVDGSSGYRDNRDLSGTSAGLLGGPSVPQLLEELRSRPSRQLRRLEAVVAHLHRNLGHVSNRTMVEMLRRWKSHAHVIAMARVCRCEACDALNKPGPRPVASSIYHSPGNCMELDNIVWRRPSTGKWYHGACMQDVGSKLPFIRWHNEVADSHQQVGNSTSEEYTRDLTEIWIPYFGEPMVIRTDPEGAFISSAWEQFCGEYRIEVSVQPGEAHWRTAKVERTFGIIKDSLNRLDRQLSATICQTLASLVCSAFSDTVSVHGSSPFELRPEGFLKVEFEDNEGFGTTCHPEQECLKIGT